MTRVALKDSSSISEAKDDNISISKYYSLILHKCTPITIACTGCNNCQWKEPSPSELGSSIR